ncbi:hypothetical protein [Gracilibacillus sp. JCM 18860]
MGGYVIPVENYQYQQYQQRVTKRERDPFPIERLYQFNLTVIMTDFAKRM